MSEASYYFLPWVRSGLLRNDQAMPVLGEQAFQSTASLPERATIHVNLLLNEQEVDIPNMSLYGPGDVTGIDAREVVRTEPKHLIPDFPPHLFPFIEFDRPDFPWLFTPGKPDSNDCLLPWIVLVVLRKDDGKIITDITKPSPELECKIKELPDLNEAWAWAHAQYIGPSETSQNDIPGKLAAEPLLNVSRLLCARRLKANEHYIACVVPAFKVIEKPDQNNMKSNQLAPAWELSDSDKLEDSIKLPVYYHWEFGTAAEGDFEDFIYRLRMPNELDKKNQAAFFRHMDVSSVFNDKERPAQPITLDIISALELEAIDKPLTEENLEEVKDKIKDQIKAPQSISDNVQPPVYGSWYVNDNTSSIQSFDISKLPVWCQQLNLDPRYRVAAALGTQVIQRQQEQLMASAWEQASGWNAANRLARQKQLAEKVTNSIFKRFEQLSVATLMQITEPVAEAVEQHLSTVKKISATSRSVEASAKFTGNENQEEQVLVSASCRRFMRSQGQIFRRALATDQQKLKSRELQPLQATIFSSAVQPLTPIVKPITAEKISTEETIAPQAVTIHPTMETSQFMVTPIMVEPIKPVIASGPAPQAAKVEIFFPWALASYHPIFYTQSLQVLPPSQQVSIETTRKNRLESIRPDLTFAEDLQNRIEIQKTNFRRFRNIEVKDQEAPEPIQNIAQLATDIPSFSQPMYEPLRELFQEMLIPGLDQIPNNSLVILKTNSAFIEAYMVGLNHEMSRELLWREYPAQLDKTFFKKFWDDQGSGKATEDDIPEIKNWKQVLGKNLAMSDQKEVWMLLIKGDLLTRFPNVIIYTIKGSLDEDDKDSKIQFPILRVNLISGVTLLGFSIDPPPDKDSNNWSFVLQEHPTETRFGLDIERDVPPSSWRDLAWNQVPLREDGSGYIYLKPQSTEKESEAVKKYTALPNLPTASWGKNSAHMAYISLQKPYQTVIPSSRWFME